MSEEDNKNERLEEELFEEEGSPNKEEVAKEEVKVGQANAKVSSDPFTVEVLEDKESPYLGVPTIQLKKFLEALERNADAAENLKGSLVKWRKVLESTVSKYTPEGDITPRFYEEDSSFEQGVLTPGGLKSISSLKLKEKSGELKGELALLRISNFLGLGNVVNIPLPHSGIWVTIKPPSEKDLIDFYNSLYREKIILGRNTNGYTLTNMSVHINYSVYNFILRHIHSVNNADISKEDLSKKLILHDFPILVWGLACTMYPNGFDYRRACVNDVTECDHIEEGKVNLDKLLWVDNSSLTDAQKLILDENRPNKLNIESYNKYQVEHKRLVSRTVEIQDGLKIKLRTPTFDQFTTEGLKWVNHITALVERSLIGVNNNEDNESNEDEKRESLNQYVRASTLSQYNFFVDEIHIQDSVIKDRSSIDEVLSELSSHDKLRPKIIESILKFKNDITIACIGVPEYKCPNCGFNQVSKVDVSDNLEGVIPIDVLSTFFLVLTSRIGRILDREM